MDTKWLLNFMKLFRLAVTNLRIYPLNNSSVVNSINAIEDYLKEYFMANDSIIFTELSGKLNVVGIENAPPEMQPISEELARNFSKCKISSLTIRKDYTHDELIFVLQNLSKYFRGDWLSAASEKGFNNLEFNQVRYVAVSEEETVVKKISALVSEKSSDITGIITLLKEAYDLMDDLPPENRTKAVTRLAVDLSTQDTAILKEIFERDLPSKIEESGIKDKLLASLTKEKISDVYQQIIKWYSDVKSSGASEFEAVEQLEKLKKFLSIILNSACAKEVPFKLYEELFNLGLIESIPTWAKKGALPENLAEQLEIVMNLSDENLIMSLWSERIPEITEKLIAARLKEKLVKLLLKVVNNYKNIDYNIRIRVSEILTEMIKIMKAQGYENLISVCERTLYEWFENEEMMSIYEPLSDIMYDRVINHILNSKIEHAQHNFELFKMLGSEINQNAEKRKYIVSFLDKRIFQIIPILLNDVKSSDEVKKKNAFEFLSKIGAEALDPLVKIVKEVDDAHIRLLAAGILKNLGAPATQRIKEELNLGLTKEEILKFIDILRFMGDGQFFDEVKGLMRYPDLGIKTEIIRYFSSIAIPEVDKLLTELLSDEALAKPAMKAIVQRKSREAVPSLIHLISTTKDWGIKEEAAIAMGEIADRRFEKPLIELLGSRRMLFRPLSMSQEKARIRAAYVLRKFRNTPEIIKALKKASGDKYHAVAITAAESLRILDDKRI